MAGHGEASWTDGPIHVTFGFMTITLTPNAEAFLQQLRQSESPEEIVERALQRLAAEEATSSRQMTPSEAVDSNRELRKGVTLGGVSIKELINEGRKY